MKYFLIPFLLIFLCWSKSFAQDEKYILHYDTCENFIHSPYTADIDAISGKKCIVLTQENSENIIILANNSLFFPVEKFSDSLQNELKKKYYRGENLEVSLRGEIQKINDNIVSISVGEKKYFQLFTLKPGYEILFGKDAVIQNFPLISKYCDVESFLLNCPDTFHKSLQDKVEDIFSNIFLKGEDLFSKDEAFLLAEKDKIEKIQFAFQDIKKEYIHSENIVFLIESIEYKLKIYMSLIDNTLLSKKNSAEISQKNDAMKGSYTSRLGRDIFIYSGELYIYFYYKNTLINTLPLNLSHFSEEEIQNLGLSGEKKELLTKEIIKKYSLGKIENPEMQDWRLIYKNWFSGPTSILVKEGGYRYAISGYPVGFSKVGENIIFLSQDIKKQYQFVGKLSKKTLVEEIYKIPNSETKILGYRIIEHLLFVKCEENGQIYEISFPIE